MLVAFVASFRNRPLAAVERLALAVPDVPRQLVADGVAKGAVLVSTCNRVELYLDTADAGLARDAVTAAVSLRALYPAHEAAEVFTALDEADAVTHLFAVAASLDSMVIGEQEISGQVRKALKTAQASGSSGGAVTRLFENAIRTSRAVASATGIGTSGRSVTSVALDLAESTVEFRDARVVLVGTGQFAASGVNALRARGAHVIGVFSPSGRARDFGELYGIEPLDVSELSAALADADVVYAASGGEGVVISAGMLASARSSRPWPLTVIDLALHRDLEPAVAGLTGVSVVSLEDVRTHAPRENPDAHASALAIATASAQAFIDDLGARRRATANAAATPPSMF
jgi:glutamyl-tRNA reductase